MAVRKLIEESTQGDRNTNGTSLLLTPARRAAILESMVATPAELDALNMETQADGVGWVFQNQSRLD